VYPFTCGRHRGRMLKRVSAYSMTTTSEATREMKPTSNYANRRCQKAGYVAWLTCVWDYLLFPLAFFLPAFNSRLSLLIPLSCFCCLLACQSPLPRQRCFASCVFHTFRPVHHFRTVSHLNYCLSRNDVQIMHLVAVRAKNHQIADNVVVTISVEMSHF